MKRFDFRGFIRSFDVGGGARDHSVTEILSYTGFSLRSPMPITPALLALRISERVGLFRPAGTALARDDVGVDTRDLDLCR